MNEFPASVTVPVQPCPPPPPPATVTIQRGRLEALSLLLERGSDLESRTGTDGTPLVWGCMGGNSPVVRYLLERGANISAITKVLLYGEVPCVVVFFFAAAACVSDVTAAVVGGERVVPLLASSSEAEAVVGDGAFRFVCWPRLRWLIKQSVRGGQPFSRSFSS